MKIADIMTRNVTSVAPETDLVTVARHMRDLDVGVLPVLDGESLVGMITDRDVVVRAIATGVDPNRATVREFMSDRPMTITSEEDVQRAASIMSREQIRRLAVVDNGKLVGILALGDVAVDAGKDRMTGDALEQISQPASPTDDRSWTR